MSRMETNSPDITNDCDPRHSITPEIEGLDILISRCTELVNLPDTTDNIGMKAILRSSIEDSQKKKDALVSELRSLPPCNTFNCQGKYCTPPTTEMEELKDSESILDSTNFSEIPSNSTQIKNKKKNKKRKIKKDSVEDFVFPKKTARPVSPLTSEPVTITNSFSDLESGNDKNQVAPVENKETEIPKPKPPPPIHLKMKENIRDQLKSIYKKFPDLTNKTSGDFIKLQANDLEQYHALSNFLDNNKEFEFFSLKPKPVKPIKIVIKGLPIFTKIHEIQQDLEDEGFTIEKVSQLISKKTKSVLPFFQVTLPRNAINQKIFDLKKIGYMQIRVEGYLIRGITQCFNCNNFFHTAENCHLKPRCLKCGKEHTTRQCPIKERQDNPFCINCQEYGHSACFTKCPKFPKPKKGSPLPANRNFESNVRKEGVSFANIVSGTIPPTPTPVEKFTDKTNEITINKETHGIQIQENNKSDLAQVIELVSLISNILKRSPEILKLIPKLKNSEDDKAKALLLFEAMMETF